MLQVDFSDFILIKHFPPPYYTNRIFQFTFFLIKIFIFLFSVNIMVGYKSGRVQNICFCNTYEYKLYNFQEKLSHAHKLQTETLVGIVLLEK